MSEIKYSMPNVDSNALEEQNENLKRPKNDFSGSKKLAFDPKNYLDLKLNDNETSKTVKVRFLPFSSEERSVFFSIYTHALKVDKEIARSGFKSFVCLNDKNVEGDEDCPICKKSKELFDKSSEARKNGNEALAKSYFKDACSLRCKRTFIARVIDRDHEDEGVKFWRFNENSKGEGIYDKLMSLYVTRKQESIDDGDVTYYEIVTDKKTGETSYKEVSEAEYNELPEDKRRFEGYNIFDLYNGKDIIINVVKSQIPDGFGGMKDTVAYNITDGGSKKPLSKDVDLANQWLNDEKTWKDVYSNKTADYLELVVNGKIPVYDKDKGCFVEKTEEAKVSEEAATEVLNENYPTGSANEVVNNSGDSDDDLPF